MGKVEFKCRLRTGGSVKYYNKLHIKDGWGNVEKIGYGGLIPLNWEEGGIKSDGKIGIILDKKAYHHLREETERKATHREEIADFELYQNIRVIFYLGLMDFPIPFHSGYPVPQYGIELPGLHL